MQLRDSRTNQETGNWLKDGEAKNAYDKNGNNKHVQDY